MKLSDFDYELPEERIAQRPSDRRDAARLLAHDIERDETRHLHVRDLPDLLAPDDLLVVNDTRVLPARLFGRRRSGGFVELLFLEPCEPGGRAWKALVNPARKLKPDEEVALEGGAVVRAIERPPGPDGRPAVAWTVELLDPADPAATTEEILLRCGHVPLPPYVHRARGQGGDEERADRERYQTVYAERLGAVAAPTAGLHFTAELLERLAERGVRRASVTLHVGPGTFRPVKHENVVEHRLHSERFELPEETVAEIEETRRRGGRVVAVGTTSVRVLESVATSEGRLRPAKGTTELFLLPGSPFRVTDALLTNFHLPRSSLLMLVAAFAGRERVLRLYAEAIELRYRFYSYGDAMLFTGRPRDVSG